MTPRAYHAALALSKDPSATPAERENAAQRVAEYEALHGIPNSRYGAIPWWTLKIRVKHGPRSGKWLNNCEEFRQVLRALSRNDILYCYQFDWKTIKAIQDGHVDWNWFPLQEDPRYPWTPPEEMRKTQAKYQVPIVEERIVEWPAPTWKERQKKEKAQNVKSKTKPTPKKSTKNPIKPNRNVTSISKR